MQAPRQDPGGSVPEHPFTYSQFSVRGHQSATGLDDEFIQMLDAFRMSGGIARSHEIAALMRFEPGHGMEVLARWIAQRRVLHFEWAGEFWLPVFQFARPSMTARPELTIVLTELAPVMSSWQMAVWFSKPNVLLAREAPVSQMRTFPDKVYQAARSDRQRLSMSAGR
ncbi:MAG: hypothetical protein Q7T87_12670 [Polaromonas sp.]|nr:hypothetical protein [Polaromonas sp.]